MKGLASPPGEDKPCSLVSAEPMSRSSTQTHFISERFFTVKAFIWETRLSGSFTWRKADLSFERVDE